MKFLLLVLAARFLFFLLHQIGKKENSLDSKEYEEDWSNPSEHNVWW